VQFSSISKFGLLELSRQRLRPALSEGSHITCPRCNGTGHIRDTESSALQILRMVQEESMKDNTAAVHVQVPVEVTSFLLNEKRTEITKIELKQRVTVLLVPNKNLDTPNYRLERLRHDDPRLENLQASYTMIDDVEEEVGITRREKGKAKQEPVIKGILPETPAPIAPPKPEPVPIAVPAPVAAAPARSPAGGGFFGWVKRLFGGAEEAPTVAPTVVKPVALAEGADRGQARGERGGRGGRGEREGKREGRRGERGGERGGRGDGRGRRGERPEEGAAVEPAKAMSEERGGRGEGRSEPRAERAERGPRAEGAERGEGRGEGRRGPRPERERRPATPVEAANDETLPPTSFVDTVPGAEAAETGEAREGGRRRRRGRGGRDRDESRQAGAPVAEVNGEPSAEAPSATAQSQGQTEPLLADGMAAPSSEDSGERESRRRGRGRDRQRRERRDEEAPTGVEAVSEAAMVESPFAEMAPAETMAAAPIAAPIVTPPAAPVAAPAPIQALAAAPATVAPFVLPTTDLQAVAEAAGLQWVNSDAEKIRVVQEAMAAEPKPIHVPREPKPIVAIDEGPLVLVETRKDLTQFKLPFESQQGSQPQA